MGFLIAFAVSCAQAGTNVWEGVVSTNWATGTSWVGGVAPANNVYQDTARFTSASSSEAFLVGGNRSVHSVVFERSVTVNPDSTLRALFLTNGATRLTIAPDCVVTMNVNVASTGGAGILDAGSLLVFRQDVPSGGAYVLTGSARMEYLGANMTYFNNQTFYKGTGAMLFNGTIGSNFKVHLQEAVSLTVGPNAAITSVGDYNFIGAYGTNTISLQKNFDLRASPLTGSLNVGVDASLKNRTAKTTVQPGAYTLAVNAVRFCGMQDAGWSIKGTNPQLLLDGGLIQVGGTGSAAAKGLLLTDHAGGLNNVNTSWFVLDGITVTLGSTASGGVIRVDAPGTFSHVMSGNRNPGALLLLTNTVTLVNNGVFTNINTKSTSVLTGLVVAANATLGGSGSFEMGDFGTTNNAKYVFVSGHVAPGETNAIGTLTVTCRSLTWNSSGAAASSWNFGLSGASQSDALAVNGDFKKGNTSDGKFYFDCGGFDYTKGGIYTLATWSGATDFASGDFARSDGGRGVFGLDADAKTLKLTIPAKGTLIRVL
jgi:hypothetical protein